MFQKFERTKMMEEAKLQGKNRTPGREVLIFLLVFFISNYVQSFLFAFGSMSFLYTDESFRSLISSQTIDFNAVFERMNQLFTIAPEWINILMLCLSVVYALAAVFCCKKLDKRKISTIGIRKANVLMEYLTGVIVGALLIGAFAAIALFSGSFKYNGYNGISFKVLIFYIIAFVIQSFSEELLFRGYYMTGIAKNSSVKYALISSSLLYVVVHVMSADYSLIGMINLFLFGVVTGVYVIKRGNIWGACGFHFIWNFAQSIIFGFNSSGTPASSSIFSITSVEGYERLTGGISGIEAGLISTLILFIGFGLLLKSVQNKSEISTVEVNNELKN